METSSNHVSQDQDKQVVEAFGLNLLGHKNRRLVTQARGIAQAPNSMRPARSVRPKHLRPLSITATSIKAK